ncbi:sensor histidine kinase [Neobacillus mesonae]|uniref:sensor histidine kinase n=1 Tax=Neobacillus mesonae TaxID=1193713 RepID=UPI00204192E9|nr:sensor histidine kinase [Neobacillus mesonae]MCM3566894.1 ATP-binding protein [Neobacillus mesonae]
MAKDKVKELPLYRKVLLFSFLITFLMVFSTAGFVFFYQTNQMEEQLVERAKGIAVLWKDSISSNVVQEVVNQHDENRHTEVQSSKLINNLMEKNSRYFDGYVVIAKKFQGSTLSILTLSMENGKGSLGKFSTYFAGKEFLAPFNRSIVEKGLTASRIHQDRYGTWVTAFDPILDQDGQVTAVFVVNVDASLVKHYKRKMGLYLLLALCTITAFVYFAMKWGLKKIFEPVHEIISGINAVSAGDFNMKLQISNESDLGQIGEKFNHMTDQLSILFERLSDTCKEFGAQPESQNGTHPFEEAIGEMEKVIEKTKFQKELQRAEKMNAIGQLAASVAHEIRNPMTVVRGFLQLFSAKEHLTEQEKTYIQLMIEELNRAEIIINDYLSLAKPDLDEITKVDAGKLAASVMDLMNTFALMSKNIILEKQIETGIFVKGNASELKQVLINIVKNGIEAMRTGGNLTLRVYQTAQYGVFEIIDTGIGMSEEELERLGTAFYSLKEKGTGMGMMVCYQLVERLKGKIEVDSVKGEGTTFKISVPLWLDH